MIAAHRGTVPTNRKLHEGSSSGRFAPIIFSSSFFFYGTPGYSGMVPARSGIPEKTGRDETQFDNRTKPKKNSHETIFFRFLRHLPPLQNFQPQY